MKRNLGLIAAVLAFCCALLVGPASQARAEECTTQGALALALADVLGIQATSAQAAADALAAPRRRADAGVECRGLPHRRSLAMRSRQAFAALTREAASSGR